jgi:hypothetical protein
VSERDRVKASPASSHPWAGNRPCRAWPADLVPGRGGPSAEGRPRPDGIGPPCPCARAWSTFGPHPIGAERFVAVSSGPQRSVVCAGRRCHPAETSPGQNPDKDEGAGSSPARPTTPGLGCRNARRWSLSVAAPMSCLRTAISERIPAHLPQTISVENRAAGRTIKCYGECRCGRVLWPRGQAQWTARLVGCRIRLPPTAAPLSQGARLDASIALDHGPGTTAATGRQSDGPAGPLMWVTGSLVARLMRWGRSIAIQRDIRRGRVDTMISSTSSRLASLRIASMG